MSKVNLNKVKSGYNLEVLQDNFDKIEDELNDKVLYRDNPSMEPNEMSQPLDMNSNRIYNLADAEEAHDAVTFHQLQELLSGIESAEKMEDTYTLSAGQTEVDVTSVSSRANFYIMGDSADNGRLLKDFNYVVLDPNTIRLSQSYPEGTFLYGVIFDFGDMAETRFQKERLNGVNGKSSYPLTNTYGGSSAVFINGRSMHETDGAYWIADNTLNFSEAPNTGDVIEVWTQAITAETTFPKGSRTNPYQFNTVADLVAASDSMTIGSWAETLGELDVLDGKNAQYYLVDNNSADIADGFYIVDLADKKGVLMYTAPIAGSSGGTIQEENLDNAKGYWGIGTSPVSVEKVKGDLFTRSTAYVRGDSYYVASTNAGEQTLKTFASAPLDGQGPAIEHNSLGFLTAFYAEGGTMYSRELRNGVLTEEVSTTFPADIYDIQAHRVMNSMYIFATTLNSGTWCVHYRDGAFGDSFRVSTFNQFRSKSRYEDELDKNVFPTIGCTFAATAGGAPKAYYANAKFVPTVDMLGSVEFTKTDGTIIAIMTPTGISTWLDALNTEICFSGYDGTHTVVLGDVAKDGEQVAVVAHMPLVDGLQTFDKGYSYDAHLLYYNSEDLEWVSQKFQAIIGLEGYDPAAPQLDAAGTPTGLYGIEGRGYNPLGLSFLDLKNWELEAALTDQRKIVFVTHAGGNFDIKTVTYSQKSFFKDISLMYSDNVRVVVRDNNKPVYRPKVVLGSEKVTMAWIDSDSDRLLDEGAATISYIDTSAVDNVEFLRERNIPKSLVSVEEAAEYIKGGTIGQSGGSWWCYPTTIGRVENGVDTIYVGGCYGALDSARTDGLAFLTGTQFIATLKDIDGTYVLDKKQVYTDFIADEHNLPVVNFQQANGDPMIVSNGHADSQDINQETTIYTSGKDFDTLNAPTVQYHVSRSTYAQVLSSHFTSWCVMRMNNNGWGYTRFTQSGFPVGYSQMLSTAHNYYLSFCELDYERAVVNPIVANEYHLFCAANPIDDEKADILYLKGKWEAGSGIVLRNQAGGLVYRMSGNDTPISEADFEPAVSEDPATRRVRLMDVAYRPEGRILYNSMAKSDDLVNRTYVNGQRLEIKDVEFTDLKMAWWDGAAWQDTIIKANIQGGLGWDPLGDSNGPTYCANAYFYGGCFHTGAEPTLSEDTIYFVWKNPDDTYELRSIDFDPTTGATSNEQTIYGPTNKILYRPKMTQGGNKRMLFFYEAESWYSYTTYNAVGRFIDLT